MINTLINKITEAATKYYEEEPIMSDEEFDRLIDKLREIDPNNKILTTPGWGYVPNGKTKIKHEGPEVGSLEKIKYPEPMPERYEITTPKLDGLTVVCHFKNGKLVKALTRGDGSTGILCTDKMQQVLSKYNLYELNMTIPSYKEQVIIRGEAIILNSTFESVFKINGIMNPRNCVVGLLNRLEVSPDLDYVDWIPYSIRFGKYYFNKLLVLDALRDFGFPMIPFVDSYLHEPEYLKQKYEVWKIIYPIDGLVLTKNIINQDDNGFYEEESIAYKFQAESSIGTVGDILWNMGTTGRMVPVVQLTEPLLLSGAMVANIAAFNTQYLIKSLIAPGAQIEVCRSGEVIPYIIGVTKPSTIEEVKSILPTNCPHCNSVLQNDGVDLKCIEASCVAKDIFKIFKLIELVGPPEGLGGTNLDKWIKSFPSDGNGRFFNFCINMILCTISDLSVFINLYGDHYGKLLYELENKIKERFNTGFSYTEFWYMMNLNGLGEEMANRLSNVSPLDINLLEEVPKSKVNITVINAVINNEKYIRFMGSTIPTKIIEKTKQEVKMQIAITGSLSMKRSVLVKACEYKGVKVGGVNKDTSYLVCNSSSGSSKTIEAKKLNVPIITEEEFLKILDKL